MKIRRIICLLVSLTMVFSMTTITADAASFKSKPTGVKAKCVNGASVKVSCKAKSGATGYNFYYNTKKGGTYKLGATSTSRTAVVKGLTAGKKYYFKVQAFQGTTVKTYSKMSKAVKCKTKLTTPKLAMTSRCDCKVALKVTGSVGVQGYKIYRSTKKKKGYKLVKTSKTSTCIDGKGLKASTTYYYKVRAYSGKKKSKYSKVITVKTAAYADGNANKYNPGVSKSLVPLKANNAKLKGRNILLLGSSITKGSGSKGVSFADYIGVRNGANVKKLAESSTIMARPSVDSSYVSRLAKIDPASFVPDIFACQLSLNDSLKGVSIGSLPKVDYKNLTEEKVKSLYKNATTVAGAIAYIDAYAHYYWPDCKVVFFTVRNNGYNNQYAKMRTKLIEAKKTYGNFEIIDMWSRSELTNINKDLSKFCLFMADNNHPKKAGYLYQWTPVFESSFIAWMPSMPQWKVVWKNDNGDELETDKPLRRGERLSYNSKTPTKAEDENYTYEFVGWLTEQPEGDEIDENAIITPSKIKTMVVTGNAVFYAAFKKVPKEQEPAAPQEPIVEPETPPGDNPGSNDDNSVNPENPIQEDSSQDGQPAPGSNSDDLDGTPDEVLDNESDITSVIQSLLRVA